MTTRTNAAGRDASSPAAARILIVEDNREHLEVVRETLQDEGYVVEGAFDGRAALDRLHYGPPPDLILLDLFLPVMDGWELIAAMRVRPALAAIPVVVITGAGERALTSAPVSAGYLAKPLDRTRLLETVAVCLTRTRHRPSGGFPGGA